MNKSNYIEQKDRKKILLITDDIRSYSGVGGIGREIVLNTAHVYNWVCIGGSITHPEKGKRLDLSQSTNELAKLEDSSVILYPVDGYGNPDLIRQLIKMENPDAIFLITDPRYFVWLFQIENEIRKQIPICYLNIWDSPYPYPLWNKPFYESCDLLMAISKQTKNINEVVLGEKAKNKTITYVPHGLDQNIFKPLDKNDSKLIEFKKSIFKDKQYDFVLSFNSRNIRRKQIPDTLLAFKLFLDKLPKEQANKCAFVLHTELVSEHGTDLPAVVNYLLPEYKENIYLLDNRWSPEEMNMFYNISDCQILLTSNEGWGLSLTEAILAGKPIIANVQGGMIDQMRFEDEKGKWIEYTPDFPSNHRGTYTKCGKWAFPVFPSNISIQGSPMTPYISDDRCKPEDAAEQIFNVYSLTPNERQEIGEIGRDWAIGDEAGFTSQVMGERVINSVNTMFKNWKPRNQYELINTTVEQVDNTRKTALMY